MRRGDWNIIIALVISRSMPTIARSETTNREIRTLLLPALRWLGRDPRVQLRLRLSRDLGGPADARSALADALIDLLGVEALARTPSLAPESPLDTRRRAVVAALQAADDHASIVAAALRLHFRQATDDDVAVVDGFLSTINAPERPLTPRREEPNDFSNTEDTMATFYHDKSGLPTTLAALSSNDFHTAFSAPVVERLTQLTGSEPDAVTAGAVVGMLLLDEQFTPTSTTFDEAIKTIFFDEILGKSKDIDGNSVRNREVLVDVLRVMSKDDGDRKISFRQFASVGRYVIGRLKEVPKGHPDFEAVVEIGVEQFVGGRPRFESLELPPLAGGDGTGTNIEPDNVRAVGLVYAAHQLEQMRVFDVVDRIVELFMNGLLAIRFGSAGRRLDRYYWDNEDRMDRAGRAMVFARLLGAAGDVSREVQPNLTFNNQMLAFVSHLSEYDRQRRIDDLFDTTQARRLSVTSERIRKAGRDFGANLSLYGYASAHFSARRLNAHVEDTFDILNEPEVQQAFAASTPYEVIERVTTREFNAPVNVVRYHTLARSGKQIIDLIAKHSRVWGLISNTPLFSDADEPSDIPAADQELLLRHAEYWLAVTGVSDTDVDRYAQPGQSALAPSIPPYGAVPDTGGTDTADRLRAMLESGQQPSIDQLQGLLQV